EPELLLPRIGEEHLVQLAPAGHPRLHAAFRPRRGTTRHQPRPCPHPRVGAVPLTLCGERIAAAVTRVWRFRADFRLRTRTRTAQKQCGYPYGWPGGPVPR